LKYQSFGRSAVPALFTCLPIEVVHDLLAWCARTLRWAMEASPFVRGQFCGGRDRVFHVKRDVTIPK
jgi:hypothetical protein